MPGTRLDAMVNVKNNARFLATDRHIEAAALRLMDRADGPQVSITAICEEAGINRSTFYEHFTSIEDMVDAMQEYLFADLRETFFNKRSDHSSYAPEETPLSQESFRIFLEHIREHRYFYRIALKIGRTLPLAFDAANRELYDKILIPHCAKIGFTDDNELEYFRIGLYSGISAILGRWVERDCAEDLDTITDIVVNSVPAIFSPTFARMRD